MRRETQHVLLLLLGGALVRIAADDTFLRYVRPGHRWLLIGAGAVMVALAGIGLIRDARGRTVRPHDHPGAERHAPWLLLLPVLVIALVAPPALGSDAVIRAGQSNAVVRDADVFPALPAGLAPELGLGEFVQRAAWDSSGSLTGREVTLVGFVVRRGAELDLARLTIACCAADAHASRVRLTGYVSDPAPDTWLRVRCIVVPSSATAATRYVPQVTVTAAEVIMTPPDPYEY